MPVDQEVPLRETWTPVAEGRVHAWVVGPWTPAAPTAPLVVLLPGLGLPSYARPTAYALARGGIPCAVLDLPGFGRRGPRGSRPDVTSIGRAAASWVMARVSGRRVVVVGHSTGAQAALGAALVLQEERGDVALVMAGPTFTPRHRRLRSLVAATPAAYCDDTLGELVVLPDAARGHLGVLSVLRSGMRDAPEQRLAA